MNASKIGKAVGYLALAALILFGIGAGAAWLGPEWRVDSVHGRTVTCQERWHPGNLKTVAVPPSVAGVVAVGDKCPG
jgi:hypothetical protein